MKKFGILHPELMREITALGHYDSFVICDMAFPIPREAKRIDLAFIEGVPSFMQTLKAMLKEVIVEKIYLADNIKMYNPDLDKKVCDLMTKQDLEYIDFADFRRLSLEAKFFVRTASCEPGSNIICISAAGVPSMAAARDLNIED